MIKPVLNSLWSAFFRFAMGEVEAGFFRGRGLLRWKIMIINPRKWSKATQRKEIFIAPEGPIVENATLRKMQSITSTTLKYTYILEND